MVNNDAHLMINNLAIVTGLGNLSQEVVRLAERLPYKHIYFVIKPWLPQFLSLSRLVGETWLNSSAEVPIEINPFHAADMERKLKENNISHIFFTGDFPPDRFWQLGLYRGRLNQITDSRGMEFYNSTPEGLSPAIRYFLAIGKVLEGLNIVPLLAHDVFPDLNVMPGYSHGCPPDATADKIVDFFLKAGAALEENKAVSNRLSQAVVIDDGEVVAVESRGTDELLGRIKKIKFERFRVLVKLPSIEFNPALDQPTIGPITIDKCIQARVTGILFCAETTTVIYRDETLRRADSNGMFVYAMPFSQLRELYVGKFPQTWMQNAAIGALHH